MHEQLEALTPSEIAIAEECIARFTSKLTGERLTLELSQKSRRRVDAGREPIEDSPLFGGPRQGSMF